MSTESKIILQRQDTKANLNSVIREKFLAFDLDANRIIYSKDGIGWIEFYNKTELDSKFSQYALNGSLSSTYLPLTGGQLSGQLDAQAGLKIGTLSGLLKASSGVVAQAVADTDYVSPSGLSTTLAGYQPLDADLTSIAGLAGTSGLLKKTAANTWSLDTNTYLTTATASSTYLTISTASTTYQPLKAVLTSIGNLATTSTGLIKLTNGVASFDSRVYLTANQTITLSGDISGSGTTSISATVNQIKGKAVPTLATGLLKYDGTNWVWDTNTYALNSALTNYVTTSSLTTTLGSYLTTATANANFQPLDGDLTSIAGLSGTSGLLKKTAANTWALDTSTYALSSSLSNYVPLAGNVTVSAPVTFWVAKIGNSNVSGTYARFGHSSYDDASGLFGYYQTDTGELSIATRNSKNVAIRINDSDKVTVTPTLMTVNAGLTVGGTMTINALGTGTVISTSGTLSNLTGTNLVLGNGTTIPQSTFVTPSALSGYASIAGTNFYVSSGWGGTAPACVKVGTAQITQQYGNAAGRLRFIFLGSNGGTGSNNSHSGTVCFRMKQQSAMTAPLDTCTMWWESATGFSDPAYFLGVKTTDNSSSKTVDLYIRCDEAYDGLAYVWEEINGSITIPNTYTTSAPNATYTAVGSTHLDIANQTLNVFGSLSVVSNTSGGGYFRSNYSGTKAQVIGNWASPGYWGLGGTGVSTDYNVVLQGVDVNGNASTNANLIVKGSITTTSNLVFKGYGSGTYNAGVMYCDTDGIYVQRPRASDSASASVMDFGIGSRGDSKSQWAFVVGNGVTTNRQAMVITDTLSVNGTLFRDRVGTSVTSCIYMPDIPGGITSNNYSFLAHKNGDATFINSTAVVGLDINNVDILTANGNGVQINGQLSFTGSISIPGRYTSAASVGAGLMTMGTGSRSWVRYELTSNVGRFQLDAGQYDGQLFILVIDNKTYYNSSNFTVAADNGLMGTSGEILGYSPVRQNQTRVFCWSASASKWY